MANQTVEKSINTNVAVSPQERQHLKKLQEGLNDPKKEEAEPKSLSKQGDKVNMKRGLKITDPKVPVESDAAPPPKKPGLRNKIHVLPAPPTQQVLPAKMPAHIQQVQERPLPNPIPPKLPMMSAADI